MHIWKGIGLWFVKICMYLLFGGLVGRLVHYGQVLHVLEGFVVDAMDCNIVWNGVESWYVGIHYTTCVFILILFIFF